MCSPDIPDTSAAQMAAIVSQERQSERAYGLQEEALTYFKERQSGVDKVSEEVVRRQMALAEQTTAQGTDLYNYQKEVFRPVEQSLVAEAMRESTPEYYEQYAQKAVAAQQSAQANAQGQAERNMASMGVSPNSGVWAAGQRGLQLQNAAGLGAVANDSRDKAEALGWAKKAEVAGLGKGLVGAGNASYGLATGANNSAASTTNQATQTAGSTLGTPTQWGAQGLQGASAATKAYGDIYSAQTNAAGGDDGSGAAIGAIGTVAAAFI